MVAAGYHIGSGLKKLPNLFRGETEAVGGILPVYNDKLCSRSFDRPRKE
jgi:hypothetical protein